LGDNYTRRAEMGDIPVIADAGRTYTPDETIRLLQDYRLNLPSEYNNRSINEEYLIGKLDPVGSQHDFYRNNLYYGASLGETIEGVGTGIPLGLADGAVSTGQGIWALGKGLATDFPGVSSQMANGVVALLSGRGQEPDTEQQAQSFLYFLQGNEIASVRLAAKSATEFALAMIPAGRAGAVAKVGEIAAGEGAAAGLLSGGAKGPGSAGTGTMAGSSVASTTPKADIFWNKTTVLDRTVYQRNDLFDPEALSTWRVRGKTVEGSNLERMASGRAPIGYDGKSVELHHLSQTEINGFAGTRGSLAEVGSVFHSQNSSVLHVPSNAAQSFRYTRYKDSAEYRNPTTDYVSVPTDLNAKTLTKQAKEFNSYQSEYWKLRARSGE
jgi:hypothetical protein